MPKRQDTLTLCEFTDTDTAEKRLFSAAAHALLSDLARLRPELVVPVGLPTGAPADARVPFTVRKVHGYFTADEFRALAEYLRGAADAIEAAEKRALLAQTSEAK